MAVTATPLPAGEQATGRTTLPTSLPHQVRRVADRARVLVRLHGLAWFITTVCVAAIGCGLFDYWLRWQDLGLRLLCWGVFWTIALWAGRRHLYPAWRYRCTPLQAAGRIERRFPAIRDRLSHAVAFAQQGMEDPLAGSLLLRQEMVAQTESLASPLDFAECLDPWPTRRAIAAAWIAVSTIGLLGWLDPNSAVLAGKRLLAPWQEQPWPRRHMLAFADAPSVLAAGRDFEVELGDRNGRLPASVEIHYWFDGDEPAAIISQPMQPFGEKMLHRFPRIPRGFRYRATGGDDHGMPWQAVQVVQPPSVTQWELTLEAPPYSGLAGRVADGNCRALHGTRVGLRARASRPIAEAWLETDTVPDGEPIRLTVDADQYGFSLEASGGLWQIQQSGSFGFRLVDTSGLDSGVGQRWSIDAVPDLPPTVSLNRPASDQALTPQALVHLDAVVKDDLAIRSAELRYRRARPEASEEQTVVLITGPDRVTPDSPQVARRLEDGVQQTIQSTWDLSALEGLQPGERIDLRIVASDYLRQEGESVTRRITIISEDELADRVVQRRADMLAEIAEIARLQQQALARTAELEIQAREVGQLDQEDLDLLQGAELNQRQVQQQLGQRGTGVAARLAVLVADLESNRADPAAALPQLAALLATVEQLNATTLPQVQHQLVDGVKVAREILHRRGTQDQSAVEPQLREQLRALIAAAAEGQRETLQALQRVLGESSQWDSYRRLARDAGRIHRDQRELHQQTRQLRQETLTRDPRDLPDQARASLLRLAERQHELAMRFDAWRTAMQAAGQMLQDDDPRAAATLSATLDTVRRQGISGAMRDAAQGLEMNRLGQAEEQQGNLVNQLQAIHELLTNRTRQTASTTDGQPTDRRRQLLQQGLADALAHQTQLREATLESHRARPDPKSADRTGWPTRVAELAARQLAVQRDIAQLQVTVTELESFALALGDAVQWMGEAVDNLRRQDTGGDTQQAQQSAIDRLQLVLQTLAESAQDETSSAQDSVSADPGSDGPQAHDPRMLLAQLKLVLALQEEVNRSTARLAATASSPDRRVEDGARDARELARRQGVLAELVRRLTTAPESVPSTPTEDPTSPAPNLLDALEQALETKRKGD